jgi:hypothetical protein
VGQADLVPTGHAEPVLLRTDAELAFERGAERESTAVAHLASDGADGCVGFAQQVGGECETPAGEKRQWRFTNEIGEPTSEGRA